MKAETTHETSVDTCDLTQAPTRELLFVVEGVKGGLEGAVIFLAERSTKDGGLIYRIGGPDNHTAISQIKLSWEEMEVVQARPYRSGDVITITIGD